MGLDIRAVVPAYRVRDKVLGVLGRMPSYLTRIYVIDDACPDCSGDLVNMQCADSRVEVIRHDVNQGVGGAVMTGYQRGMEDGADILVKVDGDGQMDPSLIVDLVLPIAMGEADYTKGNRFYDPRMVSSMPTVRLIGNAILSFVSKVSTGYWNIFDPTNGFTAIHRTALDRIRLHSVSRRYFFETDMLFRLNIVRAKVMDVPMRPVYEDETSSLRVLQVIPEFLLKHVAIGWKRVFYNYFLRDFSIASVELVLGAGMLVFGIVYGVSEWTRSIQTGEPSTAGAVMLSALPVIVGIQLLLSFLSYDIASVPNHALSESCLE